MSTGPRNAPVIVKRRKIVVAGGHHGGAWKVAYADFVTAMMAFFMLMWLLGATTEKQRKGIADYFNPTIPVVRATGGGSGVFGGDSIFSERKLAQNGIGAGLERPTAERQARGSFGSKDQGAGDPTRATADSTEFAAVQSSLQGRAGESMVTELMMRHVVTRLSDEGLVIELFSGADTPLFDADDRPSDTLRALAASIAEVAGLVTNKVAVQAHMRGSADGGSLWGRSGARAESMRALLAEFGMPPKRIARVTGFADSEPVSDDPGSSRNDRIEIVLLRNRI